MDLFIGLDIGGTKISIVLADEKAIILNKIKFLTKATFEENIELIINSINKLIIKDKDRVKAIGISAGGPLDSKNGVFISPPHLKTWHGKNIKNILEKEFNILTFLENDANACALAEYYYGNGKNSDNFAFLTFGTGLGAGFIFGGKLYQGSNYQAGEIGHIRISNDGPLCYGKRGCIESFCCGDGISKLHKELTNQNLSTKEIFDLAEKKNNQQAINTIKISSEKLGYTLALLIDLLALDCIVIGSIYTRSTQIINKYMLPILDKEILDINKGLCRIRISSLGESLGDVASITVAQEGLKSE
ncbi:MAG: ROK family protein [Pleomorphochaeta sp.]